MAEPEKIIKDGQEYVPAGTAASTKTSDVAPVELKVCRCNGKEVTTVVGYDSVPSYTGELPSPLQIMWYVPKTKELLKASFSDTEIRVWIKQAAAYYGIPHILLAVILQQENGPKGSKFLQTMQFGERSLTTLLAIVDNMAFDAVPDKLAGGSSGFANMSRATLQKSVQYTENYYCKKPLPEDVQYRIFGWNQDTRIPGDDWKADLYYCAGHLRELIDRVTGTRCHSGTLTADQLKKVIASYNGSGPLAEKYSSDAMTLLEAAKAGTAWLYFYEK
ncbi:hypothetical protein [Pseudomonas sp. efr-133-TYG-5]|jgi:hypothetical protein|uniref:hypothetical protein n=1 Tax=Pseudomonas sp. efr-133-TYG-5 TaxID=3040310 RepID=UPI002556B85A|nr:hypothetical protein [Pseudomonas sp. efr-133-TYG-5]